MTARERLRKFRLKKGWTQAILAENLRCSKIMVTFVETGRRTPGRELAARIEHLTYFDDRIEALDW